MCSNPYPVANCLNSLDEYWGPLSVTSLSGIPYSAKMLFKWLMIACNVMLVSFLIMGNLLYSLDSRRC